MLWQMVTRPIRRYLSAIGRKGGKAGRGLSKRRGNSAYYRRLALRSARVRATKPPGE